MTIRTDGSEKGYLLLTGTRKVQSIIVWLEGLHFQGRSLAQIRGGAVPPEQVPGGNFSVTFGDN